MNFNSINKITLIGVIILIAGFNNYGQTNASEMEKEKSKKTELTAIQYHVTQEKGTEKPFTGDYWNVFEKGTYHCICCDKKLFESNTKYKTSCGWPSFFDTKFLENITRKLDLSHGMVRTEVVCSSCNAHLGHVFNDGPQPTGLRYCINSASLKFKKQDE